MRSSHYDYIIAGGGMAGLSLAYYLNQSRLRTKKILVIDREQKNKNDRTWCFWEKGESAFESIVHRHWQKVWFHGTNFSEWLNISPYQYKMIRGEHGVFGKKVRVPLSQLFIATGKRFGFMGLIFLNGLIYRLISTK